jgi:uncharacterized protein
MIDMSIGKLLLLALIILVVWYGFKYVARVEAMRQKLRAEAQRRRAGGNIGGGNFAGGGRAAAKPVEDLVKCQKCGAFVAAEGAANCGKSGCPWSA